MNDFEYIKDVLSIKTAARYYGLKLNHADMCCCPMHGEKTPSMKKNEKGKTSIVSAVMNTVMSLTLRLNFTGSQPLKQLKS